ncbi:MAG TPA: selenocysteine-specific translation elongation factor [Gaiellaceae bacterium]|nr:selenocysteine-specific translation elongation factor [Gaiellaceae bacterium]
MPLTVATAGHIDHGKTTLVEALTGKNTDRLPEERARGISIDLGYAPLALPDGTQLSVIDVPGHERFVRTMVAGASGVDLFLLVVDANEGARPQTHEHLAVLRLLGVDRGVVALTKADLADADTIELARAEIEELVPGAPVIAVSARRGDGLEELRVALAEIASGRERADGPTRLFVDRSFTLHGIGTVVTGTLWSGSIGEGDELRLEPRGRDVRVRSVQVHDRPAARAEAGQRVAVSLPGVERRDVRRGDVLVAPGAYRSSYRLDVELDPLAEIPVRVHVHHGTADVPARVARVGDRFAQLRLSERVVAARGDRVVLRTDTTVGGGVVLDPSPPRHSSLERMEALARGESFVYAPTRVNGEWTWAPEWLDELRAELERAIDAADAIDPGVSAPTEPWARAVVPLLGLEQRGAKLYRPGAVAGLGERADAAAALEAQLGLEPVKVEDAALARFLESEGRLVRVGDGYAISPAAYAQALAVLADGITLAQFRDALGVGRRTAQLLLERFDADGVTRRVGNARVLRRSG